IDTLADPLATLDAVKAQIEQQRATTAAVLEVPVERVFPLSARDALAASIDRKRDALVESRLPELEAALSGQLLPQRRQVLDDVVQDSIATIEGRVRRAIGDRRRHIAEQMFELRGLRGKSGSKAQ